MNTHKDLDTVVKEYSRRVPEWFNEGHNEGSRSLVLTGDQHATLLRCFSVGRNGRKSLREMLNRG